MKLDPRASAAGVRLIAHELLGSTNSEALEQARRGDRGPLWVTAGRQSSGRGRRGRTWTSEPGNLYASLLLADPAPAEHWPELSFVAALACHDAVVEAAPALKPRISIKWPNDLLLDGAKIGGLLVEAEGEEEAALVAIGIGINCANHPAGTDYPATDLSAAGAQIAPESLFAALSAKMLGRLAQWNRGNGFATVRADWLARAAGIGAEVRVRLAAHELVGTFETVDEAGHLVLRLPDQTRQVVAAGDVFAVEGVGHRLIPSSRR